MGRKVPSVALRPGRPNANFIAGLRVPNSEELELAARKEMGVDSAEAVVAARRARRRVLVCIFDKWKVRLFGP